MGVQLRNFISSDDSHWSASCHRPSTQTPLSKQKKYSSKYFRTRYVEFTLIDCIVFLTIYMSTDSVNAPCNTSSSVTHFLCSELQALIESASSPSSPFHSSHASSSTDPTVYPPPTSEADGPDSKKRKLTDGVANGATHNLTTSNVTEGARYVNRVTANKHITQVHEIVKKQCEELADSIVRHLTTTYSSASFMRRVRTKSSSGSICRCLSESCV